MSEKTRFRIEGMHCDGCANALTNALKRKQGVEAATVDLASKSATIAYDARKIDKAGLKDAIQKAGYAAWEAA